MAILPLRFMQHFSPQLFLSILQREVQPNDVAAYVAK